MSGQLKKIIGAQAYWVINKDLANDIGLDATLVLQHFIDLQTTFFKDGGFYQQQSRILEDLPISLDYLRKAVKVLQKKGFLSVVKRGVPAKNHYTVHEEHILAYLSSISSSVPETRLEVSQKDDKHQELNNSKNKDTNIDGASDNKWDILYDKVIVGYPKNRLQSKTPVIKLLKTLSKEEISLIIRNKDRYLKASNGYTKNLRKYIEEECWTEEWLKAEETNNNKSDITNTKTFTQNYEDIT